MSFVAKHPGQALAVAHPGPLPAPLLPASPVAVSAPSGSETLSIDFRSVFAALMRRKLWVLIPLMLATLGGGGYILTLTPRYSSMVQILVDPREIQVIRSDAPLRQQAPEASATLAENSLVILRSSTVLMKVVERENLTDDVEFVGKPGTLPGPQTAEALKLKALTTLEVERLYNLRRDLLRLRNAVMPLVDVCRRLEHTEHLAVDDVMRHQFRDVTDHIRRVQEEIESLREVLAFAFEASLMTGQAQQTEISRKLSSGAAILAVPTAVAGIYGMNFKNMPELETTYGYPVVLTFIISTCVILFWRFRKNGWL